MYHPTGQIGSGRLPESSAQKAEEACPESHGHKLGPESSLLGVPYLGTYGLRHLDSFSWCALSHPFSEQLQSNKEKATLIFHEFLFGRRSLCSDLPGLSPAQELGFSHPATESPCLPPSSAPIRPFHPSPIISIPPAKFSQASRQLCPVPGTWNSFFLLLHRVHSRRSHFSSISNRT